MSAREAIDSYILAKDHNRPHLMARAFAEDATLRMVVKTGTISFPPEVSGREEIADVLVRRFGQVYENVHTFCLAEPPPAGAAHFSCDWLVGMSSKADGQARVGCGRYDWVFGGGDGSRKKAAHLTITIEDMVVLAATELPRVMEWLSPLPHPWCGADQALRGAPASVELAPVIEYCTLQPQRRRFS